MNSKPLVYVKFLLQKIMTRIFIVDPNTSKLLTAEEWKNKAEDTEKAQFVVIVPEDGSQAFAIAKKTLGEYPWREAKEKAAALTDTLNNNPFPEWNLPTRKQWIDIREGRSCGLDQVLALIGGHKLLNDLRSGEWFWTSEAWVPAGTSANDYEKEKGNAYGAWCSIGNYDCACDLMDGIYLALPLMLYNLQNTYER